MLNTSFFGGGEYWEKLGFCDHDFHVSPKRSCNMCVFLLFGLGYQAGNTPISPVCRCTQTPLSNNTQQEVSHSLMEVNWSEFFEMARRFSFPIWVLKFPSDLKYSLPHIWAFSRHCPELSEVLKTHLIWHFVCEIETALLSTPVTDDSVWQQWNAKDPHRLFRSWVMFRSGIQALRQHRTKCKT